MFNLKNGDLAPDIDLPDARGRHWRLSQHRGKMVILHFWRGEFCPTARGDIVRWNSYARQFHSLNCEMVFLCNGGQAQQAAFIEKLRIGLRILIDQNGAVGETYQVYGVNANEDDKPEDYKNYIAPAVYLIDAEGKISCFWILSGPRGCPAPETLLTILAYAEHNGWKY